MTKVYVNRPQIHRHLAAVFSLELPLGETPAVAEVHAVSGHLVRPLRSLDSCRLTSDGSTVRNGSSALLGFCSRIAAIQESLRRPRRQGGKLIPHDANGRPCQASLPSPAPPPRRTRTRALPGFCRNAATFPGVPCGARPGAFRQYPQRTRIACRNGPGGGSPPDASTTTRRPKLLAAHGEATGRRVRRVARKNSSPSAAAPHAKKVRGKPDAPDAPDAGHAPHGFRRRRLATRRRVAARIRVVPAACASTWSHS